MPLASSQAQGKDFDGHVNYQEIRSEKQKKIAQRIPDLLAGDCVNE